jgi:hypothetical protein
LPQLALQVAIIVLQPNLAAPQLNHARLILQQILPCAAFFLLGMSNSTAFTNIMLNLHMNAAAATAQIDG